MLVLFDIDDTLVTHSTAMRSAVACVHRDLALPTPFDDFLETWVKAHERHYPRFLTGLASHAEMSRSRIRDAIDSTLADEKADEIFGGFLARYEEGWTLYSDVLPCLEAVAHHRLGVISNGRTEEQRRKLEVLGIAKKLDAVFVSEDCGIAKPDLRIFLHACSALGVSPDQAVYVGDRHDVDAEAARRAGLHGVWLNRDSTPCPSGSCPEITSLAELAALVDALPH